MKIEGVKPQPAETTEEVEQKLEELVRAIRPIIPQDWLATDITMPQLKVMLILWTEGPARMSEIASGLGVTLATATGVVDRLLEKGYVAREGLPGDRRVVICRLSDDGREFMRALWLSGRTQIARIMAVMTPEQLRVVSEGTDVFIQAARALQSVSNGGKPRESSKAK